MPPCIVIDTNVFIAALRSRTGASFRLLSLVGAGRFDIAMSVPMMMEYESVAKRPIEGLALSIAQIDDILDYLCFVGRRVNIHYLWRPLLPDPKDDLVLEAAVAAEAWAIATFNRGDFRGAERFGLRILSPQACLIQLGVTP